MAALAVAARVVFVIKMGSAIFAKDSEEVVIQLQKRPQTFLGDLEPDWFGGYFYQIKIMANQYIDLPKL